MTVKNLLNEFKKFSADGIMTNNVLDVIKNLSKKQDNVTYDDIKNDMRNFSSSTLKKSIKTLEDEGCIEIDSENKITFLKDC